jgi:hypothetical protein
VTKRSALVPALLAIPVIVGVAIAAPHRHHPRPNPRAECPLDCGAKLDHGPWVFDGTAPVTDS